MSIAAVSSAANKLGELLANEAGFLYDVKELVSTLQNKLTTLQSYLEDADAKQETNACVRNWVADARETAYDAEDTIKTYIIEANAHTTTITLSKVLGYLPKWTVLHIVLGYLSKLTVLHIVLGYLSKLTVLHIVLGYLSKLTVLHIVFGYLSKLTVLHIVLGYLSKLTVLLHIVFGYLSKWTVLHIVGKDIQKILIRINDINDRLSSLNIMANVGGGHDQASSSSTEISRRRQLSRQSYPHDEDGRDVIGMEEHITSLVNRLTTDSNTCVVSIIGVGGLGKTTLAKKVYNHPTVKEHFKCRAWVFVPREQFSMSAILKEIGTQVSDPAFFHQEETGVETQQIRKLRSYLGKQQQQYLVVLDDIWREEDLDILKHALPLSCGKILLTTRNSSLGSPDFTLQPEVLNEEKSWELFCKKATSGTINSISGTNFEILGREMVRKCGGLPLAIVVLGGLLSSKNSINDWEVVSRNLNSHLNKSESEVSKILSLSYDDLPYYLKPCFLYLGIFPNASSFEIPTKQLINLWIAEGFIQQESNHDQMESVGEELLLELINRCIVQKGKLSVTGKVKTCRLHDLLRNICLLKAEEEKFYQHGGNRPPQHPCSSTTALTSSSFNVDQLRRYACLFDKGDDCYNYFFDQDSNPRLRTLLVIIQPYGEGTRYTRNIYISFEKYKLLSVLVLDGDEAHLEEVGCLIHLRYLGLIGIHLEELPESIGNLRNLQTLDLHSSTVSFIPNTIWKMEQLRHLYLNDSSISSRVRDGPLGVGNLRNLQTLKCIHAGDWIKETDLLNLTHLCELGIRDLSQSQVDVVIRSIVVRPSSTSCLLRSLSLKLSDPYEGFPNLEPLTHCSVLSKLTLNGIITQAELQILPSYLTKLSLINSGLEHDPMETLQYLPNLVCLRLCSAYVGEYMVCNANGFPKLEILLLSTLQGLEEWTVEEGGMPCLKELSISTCRELTTLPEGLMFVTTLKQFDFIDMSPEFDERVEFEGWHFKIVKD